MIQVPGGDLLDRVRAVVEKLERHDPALALACVQDLETKAKCATALARKENHNN